MIFYTFVTLMTCVGLSSQSHPLYTILVKGGLSSLPMQVISTPLARSPLAMEEIWKDVVGYEGYYQVSNLGNVKSLKRTDVRGQRRKERVLVPIISTGGYEVVGLSKCRSNRRFTIHRLVAIQFIPNPDNKRCVNHINGIRHDNRVDNLEWCTHSENTRHSFDILGRTPPNLGKKGAMFPKSKKIEMIDPLTDEVIRVFYGSGEVQRTLGFNDSGVSSCCLGIRKTCGGYKWRYAAT